MKISLNWLQDYIETGLSTEELCHKLTMAGLEVEKIETVNGDSVIEMEITPNRPDLLRIIGIAREISAILFKNCNFPVIKEKIFPKNKCDISIEATQECSRYIGTIIEGVNCVPAPKGILNRITSLGMRGVNNVVDITNFCLMEMGQPMHAFDYDKIEGSKIIVRYAKKGEKITTIDDVKRELDSSMLVIADEKKPIAIAGIMGGKSSEVSSRTKNILLESACFDPILIRRTSRKLGLSSDSSYRFERGVDYSTVESGSSRAVDLILEHAGGEISAYSDVVIEKKIQNKNKVVTSLKDINAFLGSELSLSKCKTILTKLGFEVLDDTSGKLEITSPEYRADVSISVDVFEEIGRIVGYDNLPMTLPLIKAENVASDPKIVRRKSIKKVMTSQGFNEVITYSMFSKAALKKSGQDGFSCVSVINSLTKEQELMRPSLLPSFMPVVVSNINKGQKDLRLFETGKIYTKDGEKESLGIVMSGTLGNDWRVLKKSVVSFYDIKGAVESVFKYLKIDSVSFSVEENSFLERGQSASIMLEGNVIGHVGKIDSAILKNWEIKTADVFFAQIDMTDLLATLSDNKKYNPIIEYPSVVRDISLSLDKKVAFAAVKSLAIKEGGELLSSVEFKEEYLGDKIEKGKRGLIFSLNYQSPSKTLTEEEVSAVHSKVISAIISELNAVQR